MGRRRLGPAVLPCQHARCPQAKGRRCRVPGEPVSRACSAVAPAVALQSQAGFAPPSEAGEGEAGRRDSCGGPLADWHLRGGWGPSHVQGALALLGPLTWARTTVSMSYTRAREGITASARLHSSLRGSGKAGGRLPSPVSLLHKQSLLT